MASAVHELTPAEASAHPAPESIVVRFAGDSGDGMQLTGGQFTLSTALAGNDLATFPDFPAEIRAPQGTLFGVSAFQINFGSTAIETAGDAPDVLVAMNPAALKTNVPALKPGGLIIADEGEFNARNLDKAKYDANPLTDDSLAKWQLMSLNISQLTLDAVKPFGLGNKEALRCKNMWTLGLALWMFDRDRAPLIEWLRTKFAKAPVLAEANIAALNAGHAYGETAELAAPMRQHSVPAAPAEPGLYRTVTGAEAISMGLVAGAQLAEVPMFFGGYPITPASAILHHLARLKEFGVTTFQAEDEIAAIASAIGASYAGQLGVTSSSGPGIALKGEAMGLAIITELPLVIVNSQRGGPSTGLPTKTEQSDLYQAVYGRNGDAPMPVIAARSPADAFEVAIEAVRIATQYMTPVMILTDGYIANAAEPWKVPDVSGFAPFPVQYLEQVPEGGFRPYARDEKLARPWVKPGTPGLLHRIGGIEKAEGTGNIDYSPANHQRMTELRRDKVAGIAVPDQQVEIGENRGALAVVGWGSTFGPIHQAVRRARRKGLDVAHIHIRHIWPMPANLGALLKGYENILVPEMNTGQLKTVLRDQFLVDARPLNKISGQPFLIAEIEAAIASYFDGIEGNEGGDLPADATQLPVSESGHDDGHVKGRPAVAPVRIRSDPMNEMTAIVTKPKDWETDQEVRWCPGCGDYAILKAVQRTMPEIGARPENTVFVSGIGCSSRFPYYMETYGFHTIHGRAPAVATGVKLANPELDVWIITGDGDGLSIGGNHTMHLLRRNLDCQLLLFNNEIYGLTKGQYSPTSRVGTRSPTSPLGSIDRPANPCAFALGSGARFVARAIDVNKNLPAVLKAAYHHKGTSFVEIFQNCIVYNDDVFAPFTEKANAAGAQMWVEDGKPLLFAGGTKGLALDHSTLGLTVVDVEGGDWQSAGVLVHDVRNRTQAHFLVEMPFGAFPMALGVLYEDPAPTFEAAVVDQNRQASEGKVANLQKLLSKGQTWSVEKQPHLI